MQPVGVDLLIDASHMDLNVGKFVFRRNLLEVLDDDRPFLRALNQFRLLPGRLCLHE